MGLYDDNVAVARRTMVLFFVVDCSGSMAGSKIGAVNSAIEEIVPELSSISASNADSQIKIATLAFSTGADWVTSSPVEAEHFVWNYLEAYGVTDWGDACCQLNAKLSKNDFLSDSTGSFAPAIFLMSDGEPTDDYKHGLEKLKQNNWYKKAIKVAIAIGENANKNILAEFTGTPESVITVHHPEALKKWIKFVSVRASEIGSRSANSNSGTNTVVPPEPVPVYPGGNDGSTSNQNPSDPWSNPSDPLPEGKQTDFLDALTTEINEDDTDWGSIDDSGEVW